MRKFKDVLLISFIVAMSSFGQYSLAEPALAEKSMDRIDVLSYQAYKALTGCRADHQYSHALEAALKYYILGERDEEKTNKDYRRRHILPLFKALADDNNFIPSRCLTKSLVFIGRDFNILEPSLTKSSTASSGKLYFKGENTDLPDESDVSFPVVTRAHYMATTACLLSPSAWAHYPETVLSYLDMENLGKERLKNVVAPLRQALKDSQPKGEEGIQERCLVLGFDKLTGASQEP